jgi:restriction system protein
MTQRLWLVRLGKFGEDEPQALEQGVLTIDFRVKDVAGLVRREGCYEAVAKINEGATHKQILNWASQLNQFWNQMQANDLVVVPLKSGRRLIAIGQVDSEAYAAEDGRPSRRVRWLRPDTPRSAFRQDLLYSFGAFMTVCEIQRNNALSRTRVVANEGADPGWSEVTRAPIVGPVGSVSSEVVQDIEADIEELARDGIERYLSSSFTGHGLTSLIAEILKAQGFDVHVSPPGPDQGIDIVAGMGRLGFDRPKIVVQVKSGDTPTDAPTLQSLIGCVQDAHADHGLLVSWGGFKPTVLRRTNELFFRVRLWGREEIIAALLANYDQLPEGIKSLIPLKRVWMLALTDLGEAN